MSNHALNFVAPTKSKSNDQDPTVNRSTQRLKKKIEHTSQDMGYFSSVFNFVKQGLPAILQHSKRSSLLKATRILVSSNCRDFGRKKILSPGFFRLQRTTNIVLEEILWWLLKNYLGWFKADLSKVMTHPLPLKKESLNIEADAANIKLIPSAESWRG